jgi:hypothetical protein
MGEPTKEQLEKADRTFAQACKECAAAFDAFVKAFYAPLPEPPKK